jgi:hypothetical protein
LTAPGVPAVPGTRTAGSSDDQYGRVAPRRPAQDAKTVAKPINLAKREGPREYSRLGYRPFVPRRNPTLGSGFCLQEIFMTKDQTKGRAANAAQPLGERKGLVSRAGTKRTGEKSAKAAGPDGPDAAAVGKTFK